MAVSLRHTYNNEQKALFLARQGWQIFHYSGQLRDAPPNIKHLMREYPEGWYAYNTATGKLWQQEPAPYMRYEREWVVHTMFFSLARTLLTEQGYYTVKTESGVLIEHEDNAGRTNSTFEAVYEYEEDALIDFVRTITGEQRPSSTPDGSQYRLSKQHALWLGRYMLAVEDIINFLELVKSAAPQSGSVGAQADRLLTFLDEGEYR